MPWLFPPFLGGPAAVGLFVLRLVAGSAMMLHGWPKIQHATNWMGARRRGPWPPASPGRRGRVRRRPLLGPRPPDPHRLVSRPLHHGDRPRDGPPPPRPPLRRQCPRTVIGARPGLPLHRPGAAPDRPRPPLRRRPPVRPAAERERPELPDSPRSHFLRPTRPLGLPRRPRHPPDGRGPEGQRKPLQGTMGGTGSVSDPVSEEPAPLLPSTEPATSGP